MTKLEESQEILKILGLPKAQQNETSALILLALCGINFSEPWSKSTKSSVGISKGIMAFLAAKLGKSFKENTRESVRKQTLHQFVQARIIDKNPDNPSLPTTSPHTHYALTDEALVAIRTYGTEAWNMASRKFIADFGSLDEKYKKERAALMLPLTHGGKTYHYSPGEHNQVQIAVVESFMPRFAKEGELLYMGDTALKDKIFEKERLHEIGVPIDKDSKLPDVIIYDATRRWLFLVEAVTSRGPMSPTRIMDLEKLLKDCSAGKIYVTAFPDRKQFVKYSKEIAWETEVWLADEPTHMIHFNGDRFMGPY